MVQQTFCLHDRCVFRDHPSYFISRGVTAPKRFFSRKILYLRVKCSHFHYIFWARLNFMETEEKEKETVRLCLHRFFVLSFILRFFKW